MKVSNIQVTIQNNRENNNTAELYNIDNKEVKSHYLPEDKVNISIRGQENYFSDPSRENYGEHKSKDNSVTGHNTITQCTNSNEIKSAGTFREVIDKADKSIKIKDEDLSKRLSNGKKDGVWNTGRVANMFNSKGGQRGAIQGLNIHTQNVHVGHIGSEVPEEDSNQIGHNILASGVMPNFKVKGDVFKDGIIGKNKGIDYWSVKKK